MKQIKKRIVNKFGKHFLLGKNKEGDYLYLESPSWDCGWYWGFGYIHIFTNNKRPELSKDISSHFHWDSGIVGTHEKYDFDKQCFIDDKKYVHHFNEWEEIVESVLTDDESWKLAELMKTAYNLRTTAEVLGRGGSHITNNICQDIIKNEGEVKRINEKVLPAIFEEIEKILSPKE